MYFIFIRTLLGWEVSINNFQEDTYSISHCHRAFVDFSCKLGDIERWYASWQAERPEVENSRLYVQFNQVGAIQDNITKARQLAQLERLQV